MSQEHNKKLIADLLEVLDLDTVAADRFRGKNPMTARTRAFGGQLVAQAFVAAQRTAGGMPAYSFQCNFISPGDLSQPVMYEVDHVSDTKRFGVRQVIAKQDNRTILTANASFYVGEKGFHHQAAKMPRVPPPEDLSTESELLSGRELPNNLKRYMACERPFDIRPVERDRFFFLPGSPPTQNIWLRAAASLPDDPAIHRAMLAYISDVTMIDTALVTHGKSALHDDVRVASLTHAVHFHKLPRMDEWLLYHQESPFADNALGFVRGQIFARNGDLVASTFQTGLIKPLEP